MTAEIIRFTPAAINYINKIIERRGRGIGFRLAVKQAGCTGYKYEPEIVDEIAANDQAFVTAEGLNVFLNSNHLEMIKGTLVDLLNKGPGQSQLVFQNPNSESECGCGESFFLKQQQPESEDNGNPSS